MFILAFLITITSFVIFSNSFSKSPSFYFFCLCYVPVYLHICLKFCQFFFILHISAYFCIPASIPFYFCDSFLASIFFEKQTIACFFCSVCTSFILVLFTVPYSSIIHFSSSELKFSLNVIKILTLLSQSFILCPFVPQA